MSPRLARHARGQSTSAFATPRLASATSHFSPLAASSKTVDPYGLLKAEIAHVRMSLLNLLGSSNPTISRTTSYYVRHPSKQLRPLLVLLFSRATNGLGSHFLLKHWSAEHTRLSAEQLNGPLSRPDVFDNFEPTMPSHVASFNSPFELRSSQKKPYPSPPSFLTDKFAVCSPQLTDTLLPTQVRLAQIVEMIHVAFLLHDGVVDGSGGATTALHNELTILGGDFLVSRATAALHRLGDDEVVELIGTAIANQSEGEVLRIERPGDRSDVDSPFSSQSPSSGEVDVSSLHAPPHMALPDRWNAYFEKLYLKSASLLAKGARAAVVLGGCREGETWKEIAYAYGRNLGIAFQLIEDIMDFSTPPGKSVSGANLCLGVATAPILYAAEEYPELEPMIARGFRQDGDVERALYLVHASSSISRTWDLAQAYAEKAREVLEALPASEAREALKSLTEISDRRAA